MNKRLVGAVAGVCVALEGCSLLFDFDGYAGDGGTAGDGGDASDASDADASETGPSLGYCASLPPLDASYYLCYDFDEADSGPPGNCGNRATTVSSSSSIKPDDASAPNAFFITVPPVTSTQTAEYFCDLSKSAGPSEITVSFDFRIDSAQLVFLGLVSLQNIEMGLLVEPSVWSVRETLNADGGQTYKDHKGSATFSPTSWHHVVFDWHVAAATLDLSVDATPVLTSAPLMFSVGGAGGLTSIIGVTYFGNVNTSSPTNFQFDDILFQSR